VRLRKLTIDYGDLEKENAATTDEEAEQEYRQ
jgi:hypothetical protein